MIYIIAIMTWYLIGQAFVFWMEWAVKDDPKLKPLTLKQYLVIVTLWPLIGLSVMITKSTYK